MSAVSSGDGQVLDLAEAELDVGEAVFGSVAAGAIEHVGRHVDADDPARRTDPLRRQEAVEAGPRAEVDDHVAFLERGEGERIAAAEAEVGALRYSLQLGGRVAHRLGDLDRGHRTAAARGGRAAAARAAPRYVRIVLANCVLDVVGVCHGRHSFLGR